MSRRDSSTDTSHSVSICPDPTGCSTRERRTVVPVELLQRLDDQVVQRQPHRPAPVRVAAEQTRCATRPARSRPHRARAVHAQANTDARRASATTSAGRTARETRSRRACGAEWRASAARSRSANRRRSASPVRMTDAASPTRSARLRRNHSSRARKSGQLLEQLRIHRLDGEQRNQSDHRAHANVRPCCRREAEQVVVELVVVVPQIDAGARRASPARSLIACAM